MKKCPVAGLCGGCQYQGVDYAEQLSRKESTVRNLVGKFAEVKPIIGMDDPFHYRNKVQVSFGLDYRKRLHMGNYVVSTHQIVDVDDCQLADEKANEIFQTVKKLALSFRLRIFDEQSLQGLLRHVLIRTTNDGSQIMVVLVTGTPVFPKKKDFVKALLDSHSEITTIVQNINNRHTSMILGSRNIVLYGPGYIEDTLCGCRFRISPSAFYQVNKRQTEVLYKKAIETAELKKEDVVLDAYCGTGTIGIIAAGKAGRVEGVEINRAAIADAVRNAKANGRNNITFVCDDAGKYMRRKANEKVHYDVVIMDPPRAGSDEAFLTSVVRLAPERVVYVSCNPVTLKRDLEFLHRKHYEVKSIQPVDMFPFTEHVECVILMTKK